MQILNFVKGLLPRIEKGRVSEDLRITISELDNVVIANYKAAAEHFKTNKLKSDDNKDLSDVFYRNLKGGKLAKQSSFIGDISVRLDLIRTNTNIILDIIEADLATDTITDGITLYKTILIRAAEQLSFISRYSIDLLNLVYVNEAAFIGADVEESLRLAPAHEKHVTAHISKLAVILNQYAINSEDFTRKVKSVPDLSVSVRTSGAITGMYKEEEVDPFASSMVMGFTYNPIYHIRLTVAEWQAGRYKANKDKKKMLELRLLHLKLTQDKKNDPKLEQEITYIQSRVDKIEKYLRGVEEDLEQGQGE